MRSISALVALIALTLSFPDIAHGQDGLVVFSGAAKDDRWQRLLSRNDLPETPTDSFITQEASDEDFLSSFREAVVIASSEALTDDRALCESQLMSLEQLVLTANEELDVQEWSEASSILDDAKRTWHCSSIPAALSEISEVYFLQGVAAFQSGRRMGANSYFAAAFATGFEPPGVARMSPEIREAYYNTAIDATLVPKVPLSVDRDALDGLKIWIDGKDATELFEVPVGEHVVQLTSDSGRLVASTLFYIDPVTGGGLPLPGDVFPLESRLDTLKTLDEALSNDSLSFTYQSGLDRFAEEEGYDWVVVVAVDSANAEAGYYSTSVEAGGSYGREKIKGSGLGELGRFVYPGLTGAFVVGAVSGGAGYALTYRQLTTELFESEEAMTSAQTKGYVAGYIGVGCATAALLTTTLWIVDKRRRKHDLIYGRRFDLLVEPAPGGGMLTLAGSW